MNPFSVLDEVQSAYRRYVHTFQKFKNPAIQDWVKEKIEGGTLLWKDPFIQLNRRFERGKPLAGQGLHPDTRPIFTIEAGNRQAQPVHPHRHQERAIQQVLHEQVNTIVATGTGSGKSFCFGIPIVSHCLAMVDQGVKGIKAIIIYPMNALANSQYDDFARRLHGSGLKLAIYTGDTPTTFPARGRAGDDIYYNDEKEYLQKTAGREERFDSELLTREEIRDQYPDLLMTNYAQLELLLTRHEDKRLFPPEHRGVLKFLVLDEVHTYTGKRGADVACLIRRLKQHTGTIGTLRCTGIRKAGI